MKSLLSTIRKNLDEIYVGALLFVGLPLIGLMYSDIRAFITISILMQTVAGVIYFRSRK